ncbi:tail fiber assembly protein [Aeromonas sp. XH]|uniref:tail fiber assembly protein n=1 Tax=Aeromonas sp. XH TaxID=3081770 RepID=UPI002966AC34|nr:tail fiber assembly protein [Aeromonas sp. XH]WOX50086.1 tail fiber assembly protein [Aeromonas sp. XH]
MTIEIIQARNVTAEQGRENELNMEVLFAHLPMFVPFTARRDDIEPHGRELYSRAMFGDFGPIEAIPLPLPTEADQQDRLYDRLTVASTAMAPLEDAEKLGIISDLERERLIAWQHYRVALYRLPQSEGWPTTVTWPERPQ